MVAHHIIADPLQTSVRERLEDLARAAGHGDDDYAAELARSEIPVLVQALRSLLDAHQPDARGRCPVCRERRFSVRRRGPRLPCRAYLAVQLQLGAVNKAAPRRRHRRRTHLYSAG